MGETEKEAFVRMMWRVADFLGVEILGYSVMSNHYHQLVRTPGIIEVSKMDLLKRLKSYYGPESMEVSVYEDMEKHGGEAFERVRRRHLRRMGNISEFQKILKQGFSSWYNRRKRRRGTLWMERFKSVLVEDCTEVRQIMSIYIDLNPVRAELVDDPKDYRHCSYSAALGGDKRCQDGVAKVTGESDWKSAAALYRMLLMQRGHKQVAGKRGHVSRRVLMDTLRNEGRLTQSEMLSLRIRYFSDGLVLGSELFVEDVFQRYRSHFGETRKSGSRSIKGWPDSSLKVIRDLRLHPVS